MAIPVIIKRSLIAQFILCFIFVISGLIVCTLQTLTLLLWPINKNLYRIVNCKLVYLHWAGMFVCELVCVCKGPFIISTGGGGGSQKQTTSEKYMPPPSYHIKTIWPPLCDLPKPYDAPSPQNLDLFLYCLFYTNMENSIYSRLFTDLHTIHTVISYGNHTRKTSCWCTQVVLSTQYFHKDLRGGQKNWSTCYTQCKNWVQNHA